MSKPGDAAYETAKYLYEIGLGDKPPEPIPTWEEYFIVKSLEQLIESGKDIFVKEFDLKGKDGEEYKAVFKLERITFAPQANDMIK